MSELRGQVSGRVAVICGLLEASLGLLGLLGLAFLPALAGAFRGYRPLSPVAAFYHVLLGLSLVWVVSGRGGRRARLAGAVLPVIVGLYGLLQLVGGLIGGGPNREETVTAVSGPPLVPEVRPLVAPLPGRWCSCSARRWRCCS